MRVIHAGLHSILDFVTVAAFLLAPTLFGLTGVPAQLAYGLACVHLVLTLLTKFPPAERGLVPFPVHGIIEIIVAVVLIALPFVAGWTGAARNYYLVTGIVFVVVWTLTDYRSNAQMARGV